MFDLNFFVLIITGYNYQKNLLQKIGRVLKLDLGLGLFFQRTMMKNEDSVYTKRMGVCGNKKNSP